MNENEENGKTENIEQNIPQGGETKNADEAFSAGCAQQYQPYSFRNEQPQYEQPQPQYEQPQPQCEQQYQAPQYQAQQYQAPQYQAQQYQAPQYQAPQYNTGFSSPYANPGQYENPQPNYSGKTSPDGNYTYVWDGQKFVASKKKKNYRALACVIGVALIVTMIAFAAALLTHSKKTRDDVSEPDKSTEETSSGGNRNPVIVVDPTEVEHGDIAALYEACAPACCTVRLTGVGHGSGFVVDAENGYVVTNHHVIENYEKYNTTIEVVFYDGKTYPAEVVGSDSVTDIAVLRIEAEDLVALSIGDISASKVGDTVITIGTPYSETLKGTLSKGVISGVDREFAITNPNGTSAGTVTYIQIDAAISSGNSGGPLINMNGQVIGINSMTIHEQSSIFSSSENVYNSLNFAIPMSYGAEVINELIEYGEVKSHAQYVKSTPKLGITIYIKSTSSDEAKQEYGLPDDVPAGLLVIEISRSSAIYKAGLELYDIITKFNDTEITEQADLMDALAERAVGDKVTITVYRMSRRGGGQYVELTFNLEGSLS